MNPFLEELSTAPASEVPRLLAQLTDEELKDVVSHSTTEVANAVLAAADQKLAARLLSVLPPDQTREILLRASDVVLSQFLKASQPSQLSKALQSASNELVERLIEAAPSSNIRNGISKALPIERRKQWAERIRSLESDIDRTRAITVEASSSLLDQRKRLLGELEEAIRTKGEVLRTVEHESQMKQSHYAQLAAEAQKRLDSLQASMASQQVQMEDRERVLAERQVEFEEANRRQVQQRIEVKVPEYVAAAVRVLDEREALYRKKATQWSLHGTAVLTVAILSAVAISLFGSGLGASLNTLAWQTLLFVSFKGLVVLSVLGLWAKHAFTVSNAYMHEAIKRSDRAHAINFGKLYLEIYGNSVDRKELINIFENWNIASESAFAKANPAGFEPQLVEKLEAALKLVERARPSTS